ncbi:MAG: S9 family peptidase [Solobacterium sp.]|nr:S9 family peptidase [Solobacterium sp.]
MKIGIEDFAQIRKLTELTVSPSGAKAALTVIEGDMKNNAYNSDIYVFDTARTPSLFRLTASGKGKSAVFEDEDTVLFPSPVSEEGSLPKTVYKKISLTGGEAAEHFTLPFPASQLKPLGSGRYLVSGLRDLTLGETAGFSEEEMKAAAQKAAEEKDYEVFDELPFWFNGRGVINKKRNGLYLYDKNSDSCTLLSDQYFDLHGFDVNEDRDEAVFWGSEFVSLNTQKSKLFTVSLSTLEKNEIDLHAEYRVDFAVYFAGRILFAATDGKKYGTSQNPAFFITDPDGTFRLFRDIDPSLHPVGSDIAAGSPSVSGGKTLRFVQNIGYGSVYREMDADGTIKDLIGEMTTVTAAAGTDPLFFTAMEKDRPQELYMKKDGAVTKISAFNEEYVRTHAIADTEHFVFNDRDGIELDGWIIRPLDFDPEQTYPAILDVHGGPQAAYGEGFFHEMQYWASCGYIVFFCNPRGSSGKGGDFADIYGDWYGVRDYNDIMDFMDEVLKRVPQIDAKRVAMTGGSYGGFMANWIIGHTDRFAAVASQRSISNYLSKCLTTDIGYYHNLSAIQADPWTNMQKMWAHSPLAYADRAKTPTLFIQSDEDYRCWMGDAVQMLQALLMHGVPARMCLFHGENHELSRSGKPKHRVRRLREITDWFDQYLDNRRD